MDISRFNTVDQSEAGSWLKLKDWDMVTEIGAEILVLGPDSAEANAISMEQERKSREVLADIMTRKGPGAKVKIDEESKTARDVDMAVRITKDWKDIDWDGKKFPYSKANAVQLYSKSPFIRDQVLSFYNDRLNFTKPESPNSK